MQLSGVYGLGRSSSWGSDPLGSPQNGCCRRSFQSVATNQSPFGRWVPESGKGPFVVGRFCHFYHWPSWGLPSHLIKNRPILESFRLSLQLTDRGWYCSRGLNSSFSSGRRLICDHFGNHFFISATPRSSLLRFARPVLLAACSAFKPRPR